MGTVLYSMLTSLDGYIADAHGDIAFSTPDTDVHRAANEQTRQTSVFLFGRRLYEVMEQPWTDAATRTDLPDVEADFAREYLATPRVVFSDTLDRVPTGVTLVRSADAATEIRRRKQDTDGILNIGGATLAASMLDLIDEVGVFVVPVVLGSGKRLLPTDTTLPLRLTEHRTFDSGVVYLHYQCSR